VVQFESTTKQSGGECAARVDGDKNEVVLLFNANVNFIENAVGMFQKLHKFDQSPDNFRRKRVTRFNVQGVLKVLLRCL
jgi:hypothetical protein